MACRAPASHCPAASCSRGVRAAQVTLSPRDFTDRERGVEKVNAALAAGARLPHVRLRQRDSGEPPWHTRTDTSRARLTANLRCAVARDPKSEMKIVEAEGRRSDFEITSFDTPDRAFKRESVSVLVKSYLRKRKPKFVVRACAGARAASTRARARLGSVRA